jgi:Flp pilus assembly pilin Flp
MIKRFIRNQRGITIVELLIAIVAVATISSVVVGLLTPSFENLHNRVKTSITEINETGF